MSDIDNQIQKLANDKLIIDMKITRIYEHMRTPEYHTAPSHLKEDDKRSLEVLNEQSAELGRQITLTAKSRL